MFKHLNQAYTLLR